MGFSGFGRGALEFFTDLEANNNREWWHANRTRYEQEIRAPLEHLLADLQDEFGEAKVFRPNRDTRFSRDKSPYKTNAAAVIPGKGSALYLSLSAEGLHIAGGGYMLARDQLARYRAAVDDDKKAAALEKVLAELRRRKATVGGHNELKTAPRGYAADHPRVDLLRLDGITAGWVHPPKAWLYTARARDRVAEAWRTIGPLNAWLEKHVGPTTEPRR